MKNVSLLACAYKIFLSLIMLAQLVDPLLQKIHYCCHQLLRCYISSSHSSLPHATMVPWYQFGEGRLEMRSEDEKKTSPRGLFTLESGSNAVAVRGKRSQQLMANGPIPYTPCNTQTQPKNTRTQTQTTNNGPIPYTPCNTQTQPKNARTQTQTRNCSCDLYNVLLHVLLNYHT